MVFSCYYVELINSKFESWQKNNILNGKWKKKDQNENFENTNK